MNEKNAVTLLQRAISNRMPGGVIFKHADRVNAGVPDLSVSAYSRTIWLEAKLARRAGEDIFRQVQHHALSRLERAAMARYVIFDLSVAKGQTHLVRPNDLMAYWDPNQDDPEPDGSMGTTFPGMAYSAVADAVHDLLKTGDN